MNKNLSVKIWIGIGEVIILLLMITFKIIFKWSMASVVWTIIVLVLIPATIFFSMNMTKSVPKVKHNEQVNLPIDDQIVYVKKFIKNNEEIADECSGEILINPYTPKQEGDNKVTVNIITYPRYWNDDTLYVAILRDKMEIIMFQTYKKDDKEAQKDFELKIDNGVINPEKTTTIETTIADPLTGNERTVTKKAPSSYLEKKKEEAIAKTEEENEGVQ